MLVAAVVCPHPPLLVPELAAGAAGELDALRAACDTALEALADGRPDEVVVVGADPDGGSYAATAGASMHPYGVDMRVGGPDGQLPLALAVGAWLVDRAGRPWPVRYVGIEPDATTRTCLAVGRALAAGSGRTALLVMGDGSARLTPQSPGRHDERAEPFDLRVADALASGDVGTLSSLDAALASALMVEGRAAWQVLAGAAGSAIRPAPGIEARLLFADAPYGVGSFVVSWRPSEVGTRA